MLGLYSVLWGKNKEIKETEEIPEPVKSGVVENRVREDDIEMQKKIGETAKPI